MINPECSIGTKYIKMAVVNNLYKTLELKDASGCSLHWKPIGDLLLLSVLWSGCCLFDTFPISILNFIMWLNNYIFEILIVSHHLCTCSVFQYFIAKDFLKRTHTCLSYIFAIFSVLTRVLSVFIKQYSWIFFHKLNHALFRIVIKGTRIII